jgi:hypothetical protein
VVVELAVWEAFACETAVTLNWLGLGNVVGAV